MIVAILVILVLLWFLGYGPMEVLSVRLFNFNGKIISLWDVLIFLVLLWLISALPSPFRQIATVIFIIWLLAVFGIIAIAGLSNILIIAIIVGLVLYLLQGK